MSLKGTFYAKALPKHSGLQESKTKGTPFFFVLFEVVEGDHKGERVGWDGWLNSDETQARTFDSLKFCGWDGVSLKDPVGLDTNTVPIVVEEEEYSVDVKDKAGAVVGKEARKKSRVQWVNNPERGASIHKPMDEATASAFEDRMQGALEQWRTKKGKPSAAGDGDKFDFGANGPAEPAKTPPSEEARAPSAKAGL